MKYKFLILMKYFLFLFFFLMKYKFFIMELQVEVIYNV